jgi:electron transfer flavoprotein beta subunit
MKIVVAIKQVPVRDASVRIDAAGAWIDEEGLSFEINEPDAYALEEGLLLKEQHGGEVVVLCAGPDDLGLGQTGVVLAEILGIPHATIIVQVEKQDGSIRVKRELEDGWFQWVEMPLPALLTIQSGISHLRYATLMGIKKAKTKEVRRVSENELPMLPASTVRLQRVYPPQKKKETQMISGTRAEAAARMAEVLKFELRVK